MTYIRVRISRRRKGPSRTVRLLVDTGSQYSLLPTRTLTELAIKPEWREEFGLANDQWMVRGVGRAYAHYRNRSAETFVIFGEPGDASLLGAYALEGLRLEVDPYSKRVRPRRRARIVVAAPA